MDENSYGAIRNIVLDLFKNHSNCCDDATICLIDEELKFKLNELKLNNMGDIVEHIRVLPDCEILDLFEILIQVSSTA